MAILLALLAAAFSGTGDFLGGLASRFGRVEAVVAGSHLAGFITALALSPVLGGESSGQDLGWGALAGVAGALAVLALYTGFTRGDVATVSPVAAVGAAATGVGFAVVTGERPSLIHLSGVAVGMAAIYLIARTEAEDTTTRLPGLGFGALAGLGFGAMLVFLSRVSESSGIWPLIPARAAGFGVLFALMARSSVPRIPLRASMIPMAAAGALTILGNGAFIMAVQRGSLAISSVLGSMFPAATVMLARFFFNERLSRNRLVGLGAALAAVGLISAS